MDDKKRENKLKLRIKLDKILDERKMSQTELADEMKMTASVMSAIINNKKESIYRKNIEDIAHHLGLKPSDLFESVTVEEFNRLQELGRRKRKKKEE
ncbi:helix-turn-helix domain-containing protein [Paludifilum halophilum]|uniref:HTH cro/C1-type domain-containing protein n=1 Tax=Paludifilum halophilum TaxID=1642702 RepID=A0A235B1Y1_9BACL|nr:helix-turn-helix transcriptional regulator [Paludifilum halophilum]OYD06294.1 hypothetical protein CHM34_17165 [Paludifilum halophilum]